MTIKRHVAYRFKHAEEHGTHVRVTKAAAVGLERLKDAYGMPTRMKVIEYLIEQGVKGLEAAESGGSSDE